MSTNMDLEAFVLRLLLKWKHKFESTKIEIGIKYKIGTLIWGLLV